jgi:hypothetical protein
VTAFLLDVNVLIALLDPAHIQHEPAHSWFATHGKHSWATCPHTENGVIRIVGNARYPNSPGTPAAIVQMLTMFCKLSGHVFWPDEISLLDATKVDGKRLLHSNQVTDTYLLALARAHGGKLATFDRRLIADAVQHGAQNVYFIKSS